MRLAMLAVIMLFLAIFGCAGVQTPQTSEQNGQSPPSLPLAQQQEKQVENNIGASGGVGAGGIDETAANADAVMALEEWKAPDGSITLQVPAGWKAMEKQVDTCTVSWAVQNPAGTSEAYMTNQIMVLKSEDARQMYQSYGMSGIEAAPVSAYLPPEQAIVQVVAPLSGSSNVKVTSRDAQASGLLSQATCIAGLAACGAQVFEATYDTKGIGRRGMFFVQTYDFGEGTAWWINMWGYSSPAAEWETTKDTLEKIFTSVKYTDEWAAKCQKNSQGASGIVNEVVKSRQQASEKSAEEWDRYIGGG